MKTKKSTESNLSFIAVFLVFAVALVVSVPLRCYQLFNLLDSSTGFYVKTNITVPILNAVLFGTLLVSVVISFLGKKTTVSRPIGRNIPLAVSAFLFSFSLIFDGVNSLFDAALNGFHMNEIFIVAQGFFGLLSSVFLIIVGISFTAGTDTFIRRGILAVTPVFWAISRVLQRFAIAIDFKNVSEILYELAMLCLAMLFFVAFARVYVNRSGAGLSWRITAFGIPAALFAFLCSVPRYCVKFIGMPEHIVKNSPPVFADFCMGVFIVAVMIAFVSDRRDPDLLPNEEEAGLEADGVQTSKAHNEYGYEAYTAYAPENQNEPENDAGPVSDEDYAPKDSE